MRKSKIAESVGSVWPLLHRDIIISKIWQLNIFQSKSTIFFTHFTASERAYGTFKVGKNREGRSTVHLHFDEKTERRIQIQIITLNNVTHKKKSSQWLAQQAFEILQFREQKISKIERRFTVWTGHLRRNRSGEDHKRPKIKQEGPVLGPRDR